MMKLTLVLIAIVGVFGGYHFEIEPIDIATTKLNVKELKFNNLKDHFGKQPLGTFEQRYWEMMDYWEPKTPKAILYICGEGMGRFPSETTLPVVAAKEVKAAVFSLEHRFYGYSQPFPDWSLESLKYLTFQQGLADIAYFIETMNVNFNKTYGVVPKWVVIGGSYAGAMSAWFRYKYPHLAIGSISSSGVVNAIADFQDFERQVVDDLGKCEGEPKNWTVAQLQEYQKYADSQLFSKNPEDKKAFLAMFNATGMDIIDFAYYFADLPITWVQRGRRKLLCPILDSLRKSGVTVKEQVKKLAEEGAALGFTVDAYNFRNMKNTTVDPKKNHRQWYYQVCTTFGWFQSAYAKNPIRWTGMNLTYWYEYCHIIYEGALIPDDITTNMHMGGTHISKHTSNTYFTQGMDDGWKWAGVTKNDHNNDRIYVTEIKCDDCAHCVDLKPALDTDPEVLKVTRKAEIEAIRKWLA